MNKNTDYVKPFIFNDCNVRGYLTNLRQIINELVLVRNYPPSISKNLSALIIGTTLLRSLLKNAEDSLTVEVKNDGLSLLVRYDFAGNLRAKAKFAELNLTTSFLENSLLTVTFNPNLKNSYQSNIVLNQDITCGLVEFFMQSAQLETHIYISDEQNYGLLVQKLPGNNDDFVQIVSTINQEKSLNEVIDLDKLFKNQITWFSEIPITFNCSCSKNSLLNLLKSLDKSELNQILIENKNLISIKCDWCLTEYKFTGNDLGVCA